MTETVRLGPEYLPDPEVGRPVANGSLYIGDPNTDPEVPTNQVEVKALRESGTHAVISQPITLSSGGVPLYNGSPVTLTVEVSSYSMLVKDASDAQVYYVPEGFSLTIPSEFDADDFEVYKNGDTSARVAFDVDDISSSNRRYIVMPDYNVDLSFKTNVFQIKDSSDTTKEIDFDASGITSGATRTIIMPDEDVNLGTGGSLAVTGAGLLWFLATPPAGYLECNGDEVSRTTYSDLFALLGVTYGVGNGTTTFTLPDFRGNFLRGWDHGAGVDPDSGARTDRGDGTTGDNVGTKQAEDLKAHQHEAPLDSIVDGVNPLTSAYSNLGGAVSGHDIWSVQETGGNETRPVNTNIMVCIKY